MFDHVADFVGVRLEHDDGSFGIGALDGGPGGTVGVIFDFVGEGADVVCPFALALDFETGRAWGGEKVDEEGVIGGHGGRLFGDDGEVVADGGPAGTGGFFSGKVTEPQGGGVAAIEIEGAHGREAGERARGGESLGEGPEAAGIGGADGPKEAAIGGDEGSGAGFGGIETFDGAAAFEQTGAGLEGVGDVGMALVLGVPDEVGLIAQLQGGAGDEAGGGEA